MTNINYHTTTLYRVKSCYYMFVNVHPNDNLEEKKFATLWFDLLLVRQYCEILKTNKKNDTTIQNHRIKEKN